MHRVVKVIKIIIFLFVLICASIYLWMWVMFNGGISGIYRNLKPKVNLTDKQVVSKRNNVITEINKSFNELNGLQEYEMYSSSLHDRCHRGESGWKRSDFYSNLCAYRVTKFYDRNFYMMMEYMMFRIYHLQLQIILKTA